MLDVLRGILPTFFDLTIRLFTKQLYIMKLPNFVSRIEAAIKNSGREFEHYEAWTTVSGFRVVAWDGDVKPYWDDETPPEDAIIVDIESAYKPEDFSNVYVVILHDMIRVANGGKLQTENQEVVDAWMRLFEHQLTYWFGKV